MRPDETVIHKLAGSLTRIAELAEEREGGLAGGERLGEVTLPAVDGRDAAPNHALEAEVAGGLHLFECGAISLEGRNHLTPDVVDLADVEVGLGNFNEVVGAFRECGASLIEGERAIVFGFGVSFGGLLAESWIVGGRLRVGQRDEDEE